MSESTSSEIAPMLDPVIFSLVFPIHHFSSHQVSGHLKITPKCFNPFEVLHGGASGLIAEGLASIGAYLEAGWRRAAGVHLRSGKLGDIVVAEAKPVNVGKTSQVWKVCFWKNDTSKLENRMLISTSRVTLPCTLPLSKSLKDDAEKIKILAKL